MVFLNGGLTNDTTLRITDACFQWGKDGTLDNLLLIRIVMSIKRLML